MEYGPRDHAKGYTLTVALTGLITPQVCKYAEAVLRMAAAADQEQEVKEWCCPVYRHMLVFERELKAA